MSRQDIDSIKISIGNKLANDGHLWSYGNKQNLVLPDDYLIEQSLLFSNIDDIIHRLAAIYSLDKIKKVWRENMVSQGSYYNIRNKFLAENIFHIKNIDSYLKRYERRFIFR